MRYIECRQHKHDKPILWYYKIALIGNKYKHKFKCPKVDHWGTPQIIFATSDKSFSIWTRLVRLEKCDLISFRAFPQIHTYFSRIQNRLSISIVSKGEDKSSKTNIAPLSLQIVVTISLYTLNKAGSQLWPALYADWKLSTILLFFRWTCIWVAIAFSKKFEMNDMFATDLLFFKISWSRPCFIITWKMMEDLQDVRKIPDEKQRITIHIIISRR